MMTLEDLAPFVGRECAFQMPDGLTGDTARSIEHHLISSAVAETSFGVVWHGAVYLVAGFAEGRLLGHHTIRKHLRVWPGGKLTLDFSALQADFLLPHPDDVPLGRHSLNAIRLACALAASASIDDLGGMLSGLDGWNSWVVHTALGISLGQRKVAIPSMLRADREERLKDQWETWRELQRRNGAEADLATFLHQWADL